MEPFLAAPQVLPIRLPFPSRALRTVLAIKASANNDAALTAPGRSGEYIPDKRERLIQKACVLEPFPPKWPLFRRHQHCRSAERSLSGASDQL
jgi:hypothetical protein